MLFQTTPDTSSYLILGFVVFAVLGIGFIVSLAVRFRRLRREADMIDDLLKDADDEG